MRLQTNQTTITRQNIAAAIAMLMPINIQAGAATKAPDKVATPKVERRGDQMYFIGSTLMADYIKAIAERLNKNAQLPSPIMINKGSTRGISAFCAGVGLDTPDVVAVSRQIRSAELEECSANGVTDVIGIQIGYEATVLVSKPNDGEYALDLKDFYRAIAAELPRDYNDFIPNENVRWREINADLPDTEIRFVIPAPGLGGRAFLEDRMLETACRDISEIKTIFGADDRVKQCIGMRSDGRITEADVPYDKNAANIMNSAPLGTLAVLPMRFAVMNPQSFKLQPLDGVFPTQESISSRQYKLTRPLYFFIKKAHIKDYWGNGLVAGLREFITEITRETTMGPEGYLIELGVQPLAADVREHVRTASLRLEVLSN